MDFNIALSDDASDLKTPLSETLPNTITQADSDDIPNSSSSNESDYSLNEHNAVEGDTFNSTNFDKNLSNMLEPIPKFFKPLAEGYYTWEIEDLDSLSSDRTRSEIFVIGNMEFNMLLVPSKRGNGLGYCLYLEGHPIGEKEGDDWFCPVQFAFDSWDPDDPTQHKQNSSRFRYSPRVTDWGFVQFLDYRAIFDNKLIRKNKVNFTAYVRIIDDYTEMLFHDLRDYDSKKMSGFVGIENQGATCYLNSLLQSYFSTKLFRKKVYEIPTEDEIRFDLPSFQDYLSQSRSVSLALQRIFYKLQTSDTAIDTLELTQSFGWTTADAFTQHDVQELNRILMDRLESKMKNTAIEGCLNDIFVGKMNSFIRCINVDYESSRTEDFWDIQLNVKGLKNIKESFENYVELELLDGDNKYDASSYGLQDAEKGVIFESFPPVLHLQLKRFEYDFEYDQLVKINDRYEFFESIDLKPYLSKSAPGYEDEDWEYKLHGVLVHQGDVSIGHYFAMIKPTIENKWFRFDDDKVYRVTENDVFEANFGADRLDVDPKKMTREEHNEYQLRRHTSAYMLVYIRQSKIPDVLAEVEENDIPPHIPKQINYEKEENARIKKEKEEMHFYANFKVYTNQGFLKYQGFDLGPNEYDRQDFAEGLYDPESSALSFRLLKTESFDKVFEKVAELLGYGEGDVESLKNFRFWHMIPRSNSTFRPHRAIDYEYTNPELADITVEHVAKFCELGYGRKKYSGTEETTQISLFLEDTTRELKYVSNAIVELRNQGKLSKELYDSDDFDKKFNDVVEISKKEIKSKLEPIEENSRNILIFLKYFDIAKQTLKGVTHILVPHDNTIDSLNPLLTTLFGFRIGTSLAYVEEFGHERRLSIDTSKTFYKSELEHGDIICFTKKITQDESKNYEFKCMEDLYSFMAYRVHFHISALEKIEEDEEEYVFIDESKKEKVLKIKTDPFDVWITRMADYETITRKIAEEVGCDPMHLRLFIFDNGRKYALPSTFNFFKELARVSKSYVLDLRYEILSVSLQEFEQMKLCRVYWVGHGICREQKHEFFMPRSSTIDHLVERLQTKINIKDEDRDNLFGWSIDRYHRVEKILSLESQIEDACDIVVGIYPNFKEISFAPEERLKEILLVSGFQFFGQIDNTHSLPFLFDIVKDEPFKDTLIRLQKLLGLSDKKFNSIRVGVTDLNKVEYLDPKEKEEFVLFTAFHKMRDLYLVVEHPDRSSRKASTFEPSIFIKE